MYHSQPHPQEEDSCQDVFIPNDRRASLCGFGSFPGLPALETISTSRLTHVTQVRPPASREQGLGHD